MKILVPLDGSDASESSLDYVRIMASKVPVAEVCLLRCFENPAALYNLPALEQVADLLPAEEFLRERMQTYLEQKAAELGSVECETRVECGPTAEWILSHAASVDLVVISRHGRRGPSRWKLGDVTAKVARACPRPVLIVPGKDGEPPPLQTMMVCLDGSEYAERALDEAAKLARAVGAKLTLYRFVPLLSAADPEGQVLEARDYLQSRREAFADVVSEVVAQPGAVTTRIADMAEELQVDLVVIGSRRKRAGLVDWLLGTVAEQTLHHLTRPLLIVPS
ncbi:MAG: universal stress protein [Vulcanimicrobiota bacterium]